MNRRTAGMLAILLIAVVLGAVREFIFHNLNYQIDFLAHERSASYAHSKFRAAVQGMDLADLLVAKWVLSILFAAFMLGLAILLARLLFGNGRYDKPLVIGYVLIGTAALVAHLLAGGNGAFRAISVKLLHALQYPVVLLLIWAGAMLNDHRRADR